MKQYRTLLIVLIVVACAIYLDLPNTPGLPGRAISTHLGLDLVGGVQALLEANMPAGKTVDSASMDTARSIIENRVNGLGVAEAVVQRAGSNRIIVEIPGVTNPDEAISTIQTTGQLEFVDMTSLSSTEAQSMINQVIVTDLNAEGTGSTNQSTATTVAPTVTPAIVATPTLAATLTSGASVTNTKPVTNTAQANATTPASAPTIWHTIMTGDKLKTVSVQTSSVGQYQVAFTLNAEGSTVFADFTTRNVNKTLAIVLDKKVISAPTINQAITQGQGVIEGRFTVDTANALAIQLRYGSLPVPLRVVQSNTVGPTLGQDSLRRSLIAGAIGLGIVILFMGLYYRLPGILADLALICYALIAFAVFRLIPVTLTLPGIAGFVLSIGMAVDANILIFERMKEELRAGRTLRPAIELGWGRAWPSIRDSNLSTLITCLILYVFGSTYGASIVKGFSLTLALGVFVSLFTAVIVTRTFLHLVLDNMKFAGHNRWFGVEE